MLGIPATTEFDLRFRFLGIPVRVHPFFWLVMAILGGAGRGSSRETLIFVACAFVSILVHEYGHGLMTRAFGDSPSIVLYGMGGLCYSEARQSPRQRLAVLICGPGAGFALAALLFGVYQALGRPQLSRWGGVAYRDLLTINIVWSIFNLVPIWPMDGGWMSNVILTMINRRNGARWSHVISLLLAGLLAILAWKYTQDLYLVFLFAFFALSNYQMLQVLHHQQYAGYGAEDDADWWKR